MHVYECHVIFFGENYLYGAWDYVSENLNITMDPNQMNTNYVTPVPGGGGTELNINQNNIDPWTGLPYR